MGLAIIAVVLPAGNWDLRGPDEGRYTQIAKELLTRDNWLALTVMDRPYDQKPPLTFWMLAGTLELTDGEPASWALRTPSALAAIAMLITTYLLALRFGGTRAAYLAGLFLLTSVAWLDDAPTVELNMLYSFFTTTALAVWLMRLDQPRLSWPAAASMWLLVAGAFMVKGPLAILIVLFTLGSHAAAQRSFGCFRAVRIGWGVALLGVIIGTWFFAQKQAFGQEFVEGQVTGETIDRFLKGDHGKPFYYYFPRFFTAITGPWTFFLLAALADAWRRRHQLEPWMPPLLGWVSLPFLLLLASHGKRVPYLLPLLPGMCILAGLWTSSHLATHVMRRGYFRVIMTGLLVTTVFMFMAGVMLYWPHLLFRIDEVRDFWDFSRIKPWLWIIAGAFMGLLAWQFSISRRTWMEGCITVALGILVLHLVDVNAVRPAMDPGKSTRMFSDEVERVLRHTGETTLLTLNDLGEPEFHVYGHYRVKADRKANIDLTDPNQLRVLALKDDEIVTSGPVALSAGYKEVFDGTVTKRPVRIYVRKN